MQINIQLNDDEYDVAQKMLDWSRYYSVVMEIDSMCRNTLNNNPDFDESLKLFILDLLSITARANLDD